MADLSPEIQAALACQPNAERLAHVWHALADASAALPAGAPLASDAWTDLAARLGLDGAPTLPTAGAADRPARPSAADRAPTRTGRSAGARLVRRLAVAAVAFCTLAVAGVGGGAWWARQPVVAVAAAGAQATVALADGSTVVLNSGSRITHPRGLGARGLWGLWAPATRTVTLDGEAFFAVARDGRPFVVRTFNADVAVLGTRFNVRARAGERAAATAVVLDEGRVRVAARASGHTAVLAPGERVAVVRDRLSRPAPAAVTRATAWRGGGFAVESVPLGDVLAEVGRRFGTDVRTEGDVPLGLPVTLYYGDGVTAETVIHDIALAAGLRYRLMQGGFEVRPAAP